MDAAAQADLTGVGQGGGGGGAKLVPELTPTGAEWRCGSQRCLDHSRLDAASRRHWQMNSCAASCLQLARLLQLAEQGHSTLNVVPSQVESG